MNVCKIGFSSHKKEMWVNEDGNTVEEEQDIERGKNDTCDNWCRYV